VVINARSKGAGGERELIGYLQATVDKIVGVGTIKLERNLEQVRSGGVDVVGIPWLSAEIKRCEKLELNKWWTKLVGLTTKEQVPVLFFRRNNEAWSVRVQIRIPMTDGRWVKSVATVSLEDWTLWFAHELMTREMSR
jgi:hypothetical protein